MSEDFGQKKVIQQIKVYNEFKEDDCWIMVPPEDSATSEKKQKPAPPKKNMKSLIRRFENRSPAEQLVNKPKAQKRLPVINTNAQKNEVGVKKTDDKSNVEDNMVPVKVPTDVNKEQQIQKAPSANENVDAAEPPSTDETAEVEGKKADTDPKKVDEQLFSDLQMQASVTDTEEVLAAPMFVSKPREEAVPANTRSLEDAGEELSVDGGPVKSLQQEKKEEMFPAASQFTVEEMAENSAAPDENVSLQASKEADIQFESVSKSPSQFDNETPAEGSCEKHSPERDNKEAEVGGEMETVDVDNATPSEEAPPRNSMQPGTNTPPEPHATAEDAVVAVKCEVDQEATEEPVLKSRMEEPVEAEIQSVNNTAVEQQDEASREDNQVDLSIEDALETIPAGDDGAVPNGLDYEAIDLRDVLDVNAPQNASVSEPEESEQLNQEELNQQHDDTTFFNGIQKPEAERYSSQVPCKDRNEKSVCSYCLSTINGNTKIFLDEPPMTFHPECFKCGICEMALGDLEIRIFLHDKVIHCNDCFFRELNI